MENLNNITCDDLIELVINRGHPFYEQDPTIFLKEIKIDPNKCSYKFNKQDFLKRLFNRITLNKDTDLEKIKEWTKYLQDRIIHPWYTPLHSNCKKMITCPVWIIASRMGQCGQVNRVLVDGLSSVGYKTRLVQLYGHVAAEVYYNNKWRFLDAAELKMGEFITNDYNELTSAIEIHQNPNYINKLNQNLDPFNTVKLVLDKKKFQNIYNKCDNNNKSSWGKSIVEWNGLIYGKRHPFKNDNIPYDVKRLCSLYFRNIKTYKKNFLNRYPYYYIKNKDIENEFYGWNKYKTKK